MTTQGPPFDHDRLPPGIDPPAKGDPDRIGQYRIVGRIGAGGMGAVYAGVDPSGGCAAVKVIHPQFAADPRFLARFAREVESVSRVRATCTAAFHGADVRADTPWLATEYVRGRTLRQHVRANGPLAGGTLLAFAVGLAEALTAIHAAGIVHRDLKPGNVILSPDGPKVLDFGIARAADATALTQTGGLLGTPGWMAPEQYLGQDATARSDMFAWGGMVAFAATGRNPYGTGNAEVLIHRTREEEPDLAGLPPELLDLVRRAMDRDPERRPTAEQALRELVGGWAATRVEPVSSEEPTRVVPGLIATEWRGVEAPAARRVRRTRHRPLIATAVTAVVLVAALLAVWLVDLPDGGAGPNGQAADRGGQATGTEEGSASAAPVEDGRARLAQAVDLVRAASSFDYYELITTGTPGSYPDRYRYAEDPHTLYLHTGWEGPLMSEVLEIGDGPDDVIHRIRPYDSIALEYAEGGYYRDPDGVSGYTEPLDREEPVEELAWIADNDVDVEYLGEGAVPENSDLILEDAADLGRVQGVMGHQYTGAFVREYVNEFDGTSFGDFSYTFDVWLDDDGYPLVLQLYYEQAGAAGADARTMTGTYLSFNESMDIVVPDESEIAPSRDTADIGGL
ncbi:serine/threonine-protein kinase [Nocardiopsis sp. NPDC049922]|uniref:serine/threonine-protein kinase n=1 Tax=Nocardiopsis sp. NPDC049922 TaxID=3155157 RepID=UPI0033F8082F